MGQSARGALYAAALERLEVYECFCTRAEIRESASAAHEPLPEGAYPGTCLGLSPAERAARRGRVAFRRCACTRRERGCRSSTACWVLRRASSTTSSCAATTAPTPTTSRSSSTTPSRGSARWCAAPTCVDSTPRQLWLAGALGVAAPAHAHVPLVLGPDGRRLAKRHGDVTLREVDAGDAVAWMARSLGLGPGRRAGDLLDGFDPAALPCDATTYDGRSLAAK